MMISRVGTSLSHPPLTIADHDRSRGIHLVAGSGSGKSLSMALFCWLDHLRGVPQIVFDPTGPLVDAFLLRCALLPRHVRQRRHIWPRILYVDMGAKGAASPVWPLLFELPGDSRKDVADRFLATCRAIDPHLESASIQGYNALTRIGRPVGQILSALGLQLDQALPLLDEPEAWGGRFNKAVAHYPEVAPAVAFLRNQYMPLSPSDRLGLSSTYRAKLEQIMLDPSLVRMFCGAPQSVDFHKVVDGRLTVLVDFRHETNELQRLLKTRWVYDTLLAFVRARGAGASPALALHLDELTELTNRQSLGQELFSRDLDYLFNVLQRSFGLYITAAHQEMWQVSPATQKSLLSLGTQMIGLVSDVESAEALARQFVSLDPYEAKRFQNVWMTDVWGDPYVIEQQPIDFPLPEQVYLAARRFMHLPPFQFYVKPRHGRRLLPVSLSRLIKAVPWTSECPQTIAHLRAQLAARSVISAPHTGLPAFDTIGSTQRDDGNIQNTTNSPYSLDYWASPTGAT